MLWLRLWVRSVDFDAFDFGAILQTLTLSTLVLPTLGLSFQNELFCTHKQILGSMLLWLQHAATGQIPTWMYVNSILAKFGLVTSYLPGGARSLRKSLTSHYKSRPSDRDRCSDLFVDSGTVVVNVSFDSGTGIRPFLVRPRGARDPR